MPTTSEHQDLAIELANFLTSADGQLAAFKAVGNLPSNPTLYDDPELKNATNEYFNDAPVGQIFVAGASSLKPVYLGAKNQPVRDAVENALRSVENGQKSSRRRLGRGGRGRRDGRRLRPGAAAGRPGDPAGTVGRPPRARRGPPMTCRRDLSRPRSASGRVRPRVVVPGERAGRPATRSSRRSSSCSRIFGLFPLGFTFWVSLHDWSLLGGQHGWVGLGQLHGAARTTTTSGTPSVNTLGIFVLATVPQLLLALVLAQLLNQRLRARDLLADGRAAAEHHLGRRGRHHLHPAVRPRLRPGQLAARPRRRRPDRLAGPPVVLVAGDLDHGRLALDRLQRADLPGRAAGGARGTSTRPPRSTAPRTWRQFWRITVPMLRPDDHLRHASISTIGGIQLFTEPLLFNSGANDHRRHHPPVPDPDDVPLREGLHRTRLRVRRGDRLGACSW